MSDGAGGGVDEDATGVVAPDEDVVDGATPDEGEAEPSAADDDAYGGMVGAFPYAIRASDSWTFRSYVVVAVLVVALSVLVFGPALIEFIAATAGASPVDALVRGFLVVVWLGVVAPTVAPVLLVARRHRRGRAVDTRYDPAMALTGYCFLASLYVGLVASIPPDLHVPPPAAVAPAVEFLYGLPQLAGLVFPLAAAALEGIVHRWLG